MPAMLHILLQGTDMLYFMSQALTSLGASCLPSPFPPVWPPQLARLVIDQSTPTSEDLRNLSTLTVRAGCLIAWETGSLPALELLNASLVLLTLTRNAAPSTAVRIVQGLRALRICNGAANLALALPALGHCNSISTLVLDGNKLLHRVTGRTHQLAKVTQPGGQQA